jgi:hypothetical protein
MKTYCYLFLGIFLLAVCPSFSQTQSPAYLEYIRQYGDLAVEHMQTYKIPASITLAQGILESGAGQSKFVQDSNNHFGIKCNSDWQGSRIFRADDGPNDCFRVYKTVGESYEDHSRFLAGKKRYSALFDLNITDYKAWAEGLSSCGYATDKAYARKLIQLIEIYELYKYDTKTNIPYPEKINIPYPEKPKNLPRNIYLSYGLLYVIAGADDSFEKISGDLGFKVKDLLKYNDVPAGFPLAEGAIIYLEKKNRKAGEPYWIHAVKVGDSMHSIAQQYGIQLSYLYKMNKKRNDYVPEKGDILRLR